MLPIKHRLTTYCCQRRGLARSTDDGTQLATGCRRVQPPVGGDFTQTHRTQSPSSCKPLKGGGGAVTVFYRGRRALITQQVFEAVCVGRRQYAIRDLTDVHIVRLDPASGPGVRFLGLSALLAAFVVAPVVGPESKLLAGVAGSILLVGSVVVLRRGSPVRWELVATRAGRSVTLFESADQTEFDQVCRGLQRALERRSELP